MTAIEDTPLAGALPEPRRRMSGDKRREAICSAARHEFAKYGFSGTSTASIAAAAGCSEPMLYKHFSSKHSLFCFVLEDVSRSLESSIDEVLEGPGDPIDNWLAFLPVVMNSGEYAEMTGLRTLAVAIVGDPVIQKVLTDAVDRHRARIRRAVERSQEIRPMDEDVDPEYVAWIWLGITFAGSYRQALDGPGGFAAMLPYATRFIENLRRED